MKSVNITDTLKDLSPCSANVYTVPIKDFSIIFHGLSLDITILLVHTIRMLMETCGSKLLFVFLKGQASWHHLTGARVKPQVILF